MEDGHTPSLEELFPDFSPKAQKILFRVMVFLIHLSDSIDSLSIYMYIFGIFFNIIHVVVLTRKAMRTSSINIILIGLASCEIYLMSVVYREYFLNYLGFYDYSCSHPMTLFYIYFTSYSQAESIFLYRCTLWFAILIAFIRVLAIKNAMNPRFNKLSEAKFGCYTVLFTVIISAIASGFLFLTFDIVKEDPKNLTFDPGDSCPPNVTELLDIHQNDFADLYYTLNGVLCNLIPCLSFPILTAILVFELRKARKSRRKVAKEEGKNDRTTILVIYIAASFMVAELPGGICILIDQFIRSKGIGNITQAVELSFSNVSFFNSTTRGMVCYAMSSQYRATANRLFSCRLKKKIGVSKPKYPIVRSTKGSF